MSRARWIVLFGGALLCCLLAAPLLDAQTSGATTSSKTTARNLFYEAGKALEKKDYATAADRYRRSNELYPAPTAGLGLARALVALGKLVDGYEAYVATANFRLDDQSPDAFKKAVAAARAERAKLEGQLASLVIEVPSQVDAQVTIDGYALPKAAFGIKSFVDPGPHTVRAMAAGYQPFDTTVTVRAGESRRVPIQLAAQPPPPVSTALPPVPPPTAPPSVPPVGSDRPASDGSTQRLAGYVIGGAGAVGLVVALVTGVMYADKATTVDEKCVTKMTCSQEGFDASESGKTLGVVNTVALFGGVALLGVGATLVLTAPSGQPAVAAQLSPRLGPNSAGVTLRVRSF